MKTMSRTRGNTLALTVAVAVVVILIAFFAINYAQMFGVHKEVQTAVDAAALQVAKDLGRVVVEGNFGRVALCDDLPPQGNFNERPVFGVNTILGTIRLDLIIAKELGNPTLLLAAREDLRRAKEDTDRLTAALNAAIDGGEAFDKDGQRLEIKASAENVYNANNKRMNGNTLVPGTLKIALGVLQPGAMTTNIPTPQPASVDPDTASDSVASGSGAQRCYKAYVPVDTQVFGKHFTFMFIGTGKEPRLVSDSAFVPNTEGMVPSIVQVSADEMVSQMASSGDKAQAKIHVIATAHAGSERQLAPSGGFFLSFVEGVPKNTQNVDFTSALSIMNSSKLDANATAATPSPYTAWNKGSEGKYYRASGGPVPGGGTLAEEAYLNRSNDDPSVSLSLMVWNWLKSLGLRPNVVAVKNALSTPLQPFANAHAPGSGESIASLLPLCPPAYAQSSTDTQPVTGAVLTVPNPDPRSIENILKTLGGDALKTMLDRVLANLTTNFQVDAVDPTALRIAVDTSTGQAVTTTGASVDVGVDCKEAIANSNALAWKSYEEAKKVLDRYKGVVEPILVELNALNKQLSEEEAKANPSAETIASIKAQIENVQKKLEPYEKPLRNAFLVLQHAIDLLNKTSKMFNNYGALSALGVSPGPDPQKSFVLAGSILFPVYQAATASQIDTQTFPAPISAGQSPLAQSQGWAHTPDRMPFYHKEATATTPAIVKSDALTLPALATTSVPPNHNFQFYFTVDGSAADPGPKGNGSIRITTYSNNPNDGHSLPTRQVLYQNTKALEVPTSDATAMTTYWQVVASNHNAYSCMKDESGHPVGYFNDRNAPGNSITTTVAPVLEWSIRCPVPACPSTPVYHIWSGNGNEYFMQDEPIVHWGSWIPYAPMFGWITIEQMGVNRDKQITEQQFQEHVQKGCPYIYLWHV